MPNTVFTFSDGELRRIAALLDKMDQFTESDLEHALAQDTTRREPDIETGTISIVHPAQHPIRYWFQKILDSNLDLANEPAIPVTASWGVGHRVWSFAKSQYQQYIKRRTERSYIDKIKQIIAWHDEIIGDIREGVWEWLFGHSVDLEGFNDKYKCWLISLHFTNPNLCARYIAFILNFLQATSDPPMPYGYNVLSIQSGDNMPKELRDLLNFNAKLGRPALEELAVIAYTFSTTPKTIVAEIRDKAGARQAPSERYRVDDEEEDGQAATATATSETNFTAVVPAANATQAGNNVSTPVAASASAPAAASQADDDLSSMQPLEMKPFLSLDYPPNEPLSNLAMQHQQFRALFQKVMDDVNTIEASYANYIKEIKASWMVNLLAGVPGITRENNVKLEIAWLQTHVGKMKRDLLQVFCHLVTAIDYLDSHEEIMNNIVFQLMAYLAKRMAALLKKIAAIKHLPGHIQETVECLQLLLSALMSYTVRKFLPLDKGLTEEELLKIGSDWGFVPSFNKTWLIVAALPTLLFLGYAGGLATMITRVFPHLMDAREMYGGDDQGQFIFNDNWNNIRANTDEAYNAIRVLFNFLYAMLPPAGVNGILSSIGILYMAKQRYNQLFERKLWFTTQDPLAMMLERLSNLSGDFNELVARVNALIASRNAAPVASQPLPARAAAMLSDTEMMALMARMLRSSEGQSILRAQLEANSLAAPTIPSNSRLLAASARSFRPPSLQGQSSRSTEDNPPDGLRQRRAIVAAHDARQARASNALQGAGAASLLPISSSESDRGVIESVDINDGDIGEGIHLLPDLPRPGGSYGGVD